MFNLNSSIFEWMPDDGGHNFGDYLMQMIGEGLFLTAEWFRLENDDCCKYVLLGSFLCDYNLEIVIKQKKCLVTVGCGYRGEAISPRLISKTRFLGCRGKHSKAFLDDSGLDVECVGDPAVILPLLIKQRRESIPKILFMPHICDPVRLAITPDDLGVDRILQPVTHDMAQLSEMVREISGAKFVLAGAMHAAVIAYAYGVPFAFYASKAGYLDCPPKWADWLSSISSPYVKPAFFANAAAGLDWYHKNMNYFHPPKYVPILKQYAAIGRLRRSIVFRAVLHDAWNLYKDLSQTIPKTFRP